MAKVFFEIVNVADALRNARTRGSARDLLVLEQVQRFERQSVSSGNWPLCAACDELVLGALRHVAVRCVIETGRLECAAICDRCQAEDQAAVARGEGTPGNVIEIGSA